MFTLPDLPYAYDVLEPYIDERTMQIHHDKHHAAYVKNVNDALAGNDTLLAMPVEDLMKNLASVPEAVRPKVRNNGGGHYNHKQFSAAAMGRFGSGWAWLVFDGGKLTIVDTPNQDNPLMEGKTPILGLDVWEHAYYLKYQNLRADYIKAWWNVVCWMEVERRYKEAVQ